MVVRFIIVLVLMLALSFGGFVIGFHEGSRASLWSEFVLRGVEAGQRLDALDKQKPQIVRGALCGEIEVALMAHKELLNLKAYKFLAPLTKVELYGLKSNYVARLNAYKASTSVQCTKQPA